MANRFLETNFYKSPFVRGLQGSLKALYSFIICDCTPSGIWFLDLEAASMYIGFKVTSSEFNESFVKTGKAIDLGRGKFFFPDFIEHQYPKGLQEKNPAHINIILELKKLCLINENLCVVEFKKEEPLEGLISPLSNGNSIGNGYGSDLSLEGSGDFSLVELNGKTLEAAEMNQFDMTKSRNTEFIKTQWKIFLLERSNDPPIKQRDYKNNNAKLYSHFLNWIRNKKPQINGQQDKRFGSYQPVATKPTAENKSGRGFKSL